MNIEDYDYLLPEELIAQLPLEKRDSSRLMVLDPVSRRISHAKFDMLPEMLSSHDLLVFNDTKVFKAKLLATNQRTGKRVELLLVRKLESSRWLALAKPMRRLKVADKLIIKDEVKVSYAGRHDDKAILDFGHDVDVMGICERYGKTPLPPYIKRGEDGEIAELDPYGYQTLYACNLGSIAAPTAGLHFSEELLQRLQRRGVKTAFITLHVGVGTFKPVRCQDITRHIMEAEYYSIPRHVSDLIRSQIDRKKRIIAVGTTTTRALESAFDDSATVVAARGWSRLFIHPGYRFKVISGLITNFHLPRSTLLMLVCAFAGREFILSAYQQAIKKKYRFYSYGDAMFITRRKDESHL